jgi:hypothetical protein
VAVSYTGTVHFSSSEPGAVLPADYTFTAGDLGVHTFSNGAVLKTVGNQTVTAIDTVISALMGTSIVTVSAAAATQLTVVGPSSIKVGAPFTLTVTALDAYGNITTGYTGTIHFRSSDGQAGLPPDYTFTSIDAGVHTFVIMFTHKSIGSQTITATDKSTPWIDSGGTLLGEQTLTTSHKTSVSITGTATVVVSATAGHFFHLLGPALMIVGQPFTHAMTPMDASGSESLSCQGNINSSRSEGAAALPGSSKLVFEANRRHPIGTTSNTGDRQTMTGIECMSQAIRRRPLPNWKGGSVFAPESVNADFRGLGCVKGMPE